MPIEKAGGYISNLTFNDGKELAIAANDIVVFVGPNNAGKSQALKDLYALSEEKSPSVIISNITIRKFSSPISSVLSKISAGTDQGTYISYSVLGHSMNIWSYTDEDFPKKNFYGDFRDLFIANLNTSARLTICNPPNSIRRDENKKHPIHYAAFDSQYRKWLSNSFKKAFEIELTPNTQFGSQIPLCIGKPVQLNGTYEDEQSRQEAYADILKTYKQVQNQGDGIKSFTGILLYLMLDYYCTYLIDEPESFLHPPQARIMGQIIGQTLSDQQQAFISTHSEDIIKGLLEACPERIKIVRITREDDTNHFSILNNAEFNQVWNDPLLKYSNIMASLFHKSVVLCESDSDCKLYSIIESHIKQKDGKYSETMFIHCGGKHRMSKIVTALRSLDINVKLIPDIDILNDQEVFKGVVESFGIDFKTIQSDYNNIVSNLHSPKEKINRISAKTSINQVLDSSTNTDLSNREIRSIKEAISIISKWDSLKSAGSNALPSGNATTSYKNIDQLLRSVGIFIVPVGELECFIKDVGGHGPEWVNTVLETYPNLDDAVYNSITEFIASMNL
ncbi:MAG: ATP-binding protein [Clostridia bacterium]|nr:ATP-binding protein [Clostridia bacterium]